MTCGVQALLAELLLCCALAGSFNELVRLVAKRYTFNTDAVNLYSFAVHDEAGLIEFLRQGLHNFSSGTLLDFIAVLTN